MAKFRQFYKMGGFILLTLLVVIPAIPLQLLSLNRLKMQALSLYYKLVSKLWGLKIIQLDKLAIDRPLLIVSNHCSYLDIPVLGACAPVHFTPKADIKGWPVIGQLCQLSGCIFIDRKRTATNKNKQSLVKALRLNRVISLFPEGTTNNATDIKPFRSSYFSLAEEHRVAVQPVTIRYLDKNGDALSAQLLRKIAWIDDDEFFPHLFEFFKCPPISVEVIFHPPAQIAYFADRKQLANYCYEQVKLAMPQKVTLL